MLTAIVSIATLGFCITAVRRHSLRCFRDALDASHGVLHVASLPPCLLACLQRAQAREKLREDEMREREEAVMRRREAMLKQQEEDRERLKTYEQAWQKEKQRQVRAPRPAL